MSRELKAIIIEIPEDAGDNDRIWVECMIINQEIKALTRGEFYVGQDDGKFFVAVDFGKEAILRKVAPKYEVITIRMEDYPWDWNWRRDGLNNRWF